MNRGDRTCACQLLCLVRHTQCIEETDKERRRPFKTWELAHFDGRDFPATADVGELQQRQAPLPIGGQNRATLEHPLGPASGSARSFA
jgi:hypothetical protein